MEDGNTQKSNREMILAGVCPSKHETEDRVCKACYEDLLKKFNNLQNGSGSNKKSQWQTWGKV